MNELLLSIAQLVIGGIGGAVVAVVALRTRLALMRRDIRDAATKQIELEARLDAHVILVERRQLIQLEMTADICRKLGIDARWGDVITRFIAEEPRSKPPFIPEDSEHEP